MRSLWKKLDAYFTFARYHATRNSETQIAKLFTYRDKE